MIVCGQDCTDCCDYCAYQMGCGRGAGTGFCISKGKYVEWAGGCKDDFHCMSALVEPYVPNIIEFLVLTYKVFTGKDESYDEPMELTFKEKATAWRNLADYTFEGKRRGKHAVKI